MSPPSEDSGDDDLYSTQGSSGSPCSSSSCSGNGDPAPSERRRDRRLTNFDDHGRRLSGRRREPGRRRAAGVVTCDQWCGNANMQCAGMYDDANNGCTARTANGQPSDWPGQAASCGYTGDTVDIDWICDCTAPIATTVTIAMGYSDSTCAVPDCPAVEWTNYPMTDVDGDGVYERTFVVPNGYQASYAFLYGVMEDLSGQSCVWDPDNSAYRTTPLVTDNTVISDTFGMCLSGPTSAPTLAQTSAPTSAQTSAPTSAPTLVPTFTPKLRETRSSSIKMAN